jgi:Tfp pilus assembly protein PilN
VIRINLLPAKVRKTKGAQRLATYVIMGASGAVILLILGLLQLVAALHQTQARITQVDASAAKLADKISYLHGLTDREQTSQQLRDLIRRLAPKQALWISILDELADVVRDDLWLTQLASEPAVAGQPLRLQLEGEAYTKISVADFLASLESSSHFTDVNLEALNDVKAGTISQVQFKVKLLYHADAAGDQP